MKFLEKTNVDAAQRDLGNGGYTVPNTTITWLSIIYIVVNITANSLNSFISGMPQRNYENRAFELKRQNFQLQALQRVLEISDEEDRRFSLELLVKTGILSDNKNGMLLDFIKQSKKIPHWSARSLELLNNYLPNQGNTYLPTGSNLQIGGAGNNTPPGNVSNNGTVNSAGSMPRSINDSANRASR
ncbi:hypothetical protein [Dyadobacter fanqingshengii]|uniref:Uncharacterized protein n=1 Tax=Dyadobacter fanqingshengii TaxID=2906443 RepID=A0A9X1PAG0_9BACT|nr:hypothetical protein [Dyadobacter fanqingshengii]MCF0039795.1 hypothetical protein [Dyadobacter fanqingshengii]USJ38442.1 hypothetical protein NFI81_11805 [Dyadobacter fanqingshengii]